MAEATPASRGFTPPVATFIAGMNAQPMPRPSAIVPGRTQVWYELSTVIRVSASMPAEPSRKPGGMR